MVNQFKTYLKDIFDSNEIFPFDFCLKKQHHLMYLYTIQFLLASKSSICFVYELFSKDHKQPSWTITCPFLSDLKNIFL